MPELCLATSVVTGIDDRIVELLILGAVLQERNLRVMQVKGGPSERILGSCVKLWRGGGHVVAHSRERPQPHGSSLVTFGLFRLFQTFQKKTSVEAPSRNAPAEDIWFPRVKPSLGK
jgi:hypothetical protein